MATNSIGHYGAWRRRDDPSASRVGRFGPMGSEWRNRRHDQTTSAVQRQERGVTNGREQMKTRTRLLAATVLTACIALSASAAGAAPSAPKLKVDPGTYVGKAGDCGPT